MKLFSRAKQEKPRFVAAEEGRYRTMSPAEKADYDAYVASLPPDAGCIFWANCQVTPDGRLVPFGPGAKWAGKPRRQAWHDWADEALDG